MTTATERLQPERQARPLVAPRHQTPMPWKLARVAVGGLAILGSLAAAGAIYEMIASSADSAAYPAPGRLVNVAGHRLHIDCRGQGAPTIVMDAGLGSSSLDWALVQPELARATQVCAYDRAGMGWSETGPQPRTPSQIAEELHLLLQSAGIPGPYILVGHSLGGKNIRMFAAAYPDEVAGAVLVDARSEAIDATADQEGFASALKAQSAIYGLARRFGVARLLGGSFANLPLVPSALATQMALFQTSPIAIETTTEEGLMRTSDDRVLAATDLGSVPLIVVAASESVEKLPGWSAAQHAMAALSSNGHLIVAEGSGHAVQLIQPNVVIDAVLSVLASSRQHN